ncbi:asparagine synthetase B [Cytophagales bacterium WSM2-2]|nr:asparagine synthetase B [Cytophagales bacterium WSM2-2]
MCGILGAIGEVADHSFEEGLIRISHRGPDGSSTWKDESAFVRLGHRRLAIIDLTEMGKQPMTVGPLTITFNGEIYNYLEIRKELEALGHRFASHSDTEVILSAFLQWGEKCLLKFNGMWAFAIWNSESKTLFLSRDRFGVKPLFYSLRSDRLVFGSEMKALTPMLGQVNVHPEFTWFVNNIHNYETTDRCLIKEVLRFPAGHYAYWKPGELKMDAKRFWNTLDHLLEPEKKYEDQVAHFQDLFFDACKIRMRSDVKIGTALSGGLDSSSVAAAMHQLSRQQNDGTFQRNWQNAFVAVFPGTPLDEKIYAEEIIKSFSLNGFYFEIDPVKGIEKLNDYLWYFEELFLTSPIPMIDIYRGIKQQGVSVSLDGHGADELFSGYGTMLLNAIKDNPFKLKSIKEVISTYKSTYGIDRSDFTVWVDGFAGKKKLLYHYFSKLFNFEEDDQLVKQLGHFNATLYREFHSFILPTLLRNYDRYSMAAGVEVRMPFMDYRLVSYCFSLPWTSKLRNGFTKSILRDAMIGILPEKIARRKSKVGFGTPFTHWLTGPWKEYILDTIQSQDFKNSQVINASQVTRTVQQFYKKPAPSWEDGNIVWESLMPYFWEIAFFKKLNYVQ